MKRDNIAQKKIADGQVTHYSTVKPQYAIHLWNNGVGEMLFSVIEDMSINEARKFYEYHELVAGKAANVWVFFNDYDIHRNHCVSASTRYMRGDYIRYDINLNNDKVTKTRGVDLTHPHQ